MTKKTNRLHIAYNYLTYSPKVSVPNTIGGAVKALCDSAKNAPDKVEKNLVTNFLKDLEFIGNAESDDVLHLDIRSPPNRAQIKIDLSKDPIGQLTCELRKLAKITPYAICDPAPPPAPAP